MTTDAFIVGEAWISEHYFTTDAKSQSFGARVAQRRKEWDELAADNITTPRARFSAIRGELSAAFANLAGHEDALALRESIYVPLCSAFGYAGSNLVAESRGPLSLVRPGDMVEGATFAIIQATAVEQFDDLLQRDAPTLLEPYQPADDESHPLESVARLLSRLFVADGGPAFAVVLAGKWALLAERVRWPEGRYLAIDLQLVVDRNHVAKGGEIDRAVACLAAESLLPSADGSVWWTDVLSDSIQHTVGVSQDLRDGVRHSIEIIANDVVQTRRERSLDPLPATAAQNLALQSLRYLYRILFLLFAEASPELEVVPATAGEYEEGYGLGRLRELIQVELSQDAASHRHLYDSLSLLFSQVDHGHSPPASAVGGEQLALGLTFNALKADLFEPAATSLIDEVGLSDGAVQQVLAHLLLSKVRTGSDRGYISYANLGVNQLGAVYEGLMSYTGFFAETDVYEVARDGDSSKGSWVVPVERSHDIERKHFVSEADPITGESKPTLHPAGSFVYRLAGRERQQSASYYTPEVLTRFVVSQALEELLDQGGLVTTAADILTLTVCEPALGSGAFAIEAVRQLAEEFLTRRQRELGVDIDPDEYPKELQRVKASIALHQVYGVDLNSTAVELAEISLWLDTMVAGLDAPWFGLHLRRGNSLIGARRAVYARDQINSKAWLKDPPRDVPVGDLVSNLATGSVASGTAGAVHHFLLPADGWGSVTEGNEAIELAPAALGAMKAWRRSITAKLSKKQVDQLVAVSNRVETLWQFALRRLQIAEREIRREIPLWGDEDSHAANRASSVQRAEIEQKLADSSGAFQRLRRVMDAWNSMWFWPLTDTLTKGVQLPTIDEWIAGVGSILGTHFEAKRTSTDQGAVTIGPTSSWEDLGFAEEYDLSISGVDSISDVLAKHPWLRVCEEIAIQQGFFHWEFDFGTVFARGGFDLQVGNPPWVRPRSDVEALLAEGDPWWQLTVKPTQSQIATKRAVTLEIEGIPDLLIDATGEVAAISSYVGSPTNYPHLAGLQPDLYRCFIEQTWRHSSHRGTTGLIHPETHFTDEKAGFLRSATYARLRRHWQFVNEFSLFEVHHLVSYGVHVYGSEGEVDFEMATSLYHPSTVDRSYAHDGSGEEPGLKDPVGNWDLRPHRDRIITVTDEVLASWHAVLEDPAVPVRHTRMIYAVNRSTAAVLAKLSAAPRLGSLDLEFSPGWHEKNDRTKGYFDVGWGRVNSWKDAILQGPHLFVSNPFYKSPNESMLHNQDWSLIDLETLEADALPVTAYTPTADLTKYDAGYTHWGTKRLPAREYYRVAWRNMAANTGERTLIPAIIPPGSAHINAITSLGAPYGDAAQLAAIVGFLSSLIVDTSIRVAPKSTITARTIQRLPAVLSHPLSTSLAIRSLRLNALTNAFADLWRDAFSAEYVEERWVGGFDYANRPALGEVSKEWTSETPLRVASDRRQALVEIDAIVAIMLGISSDELCTIYRTQFAVLFGYDRSTYYFDANGRVVPNSVLASWRDKGDRASVEDRSATNASGNRYTYELPFGTLDREADMRKAYEHFERVLAGRS
jgi:hypothetical protein